MLAGPTRKESNDVIVFSCFMVGNYRRSGKMKVDGKNLQLVRKMRSWLRCSKLGTRRCPSDRVLQLR